MKLFKYALLLVVGLSACKTVKYPDLSDGLYADIQTNKGDILIELHQKDMPMTVANFVSLAEGNHPKVADSLKGKPFYNGIKFHRVIKDFMIQGGDPTATGRGNIGYRFDDEFPLDEKGSLLFKHNAAGILSMANPAPNSNASQFFITHKATPWLDSRHSIFGRVQIGQTVVDTIEQNDYIKAITIIRIGEAAEAFNAPEIFSSEVANPEKRKADREAKLALARVLFQKEMGIDKAVKTDSGLKFLRLKEGDGKRVNPALPTTVHYTLYSTEGKKISSSKDVDKPFTFTINNDAMIPGWKEGAAMMYEGEKARLFIPSYLAYGSVGRKPVIKPNTDLIFEIEILKVGK